MKFPILSSQQAPSRLLRRAPAPFTALATGMLASYLPGLLPSGVGAQLSYLGWMVPLLVCGLVVLRRPRLVRFPLWLWLPWVLWVAAYLPFAEADNTLQRGVMLMTPLVVGAGFSTLRVDAPLIEKFRLWLHRFIWIFISAAGVSTGLLVTGQLAASTGFATGAITASLLAAWYAARYAGGDLRALAYWAVLAAVPVLANTRTGMVAVALTLPLTLAPLSLKKRLIAVAVLVVAGLLVFQMEHIQKKMFYSGQGTMSDAVTGVLEMFSGEEPTSYDFATSGRKRIYTALLDGLDEAYWLGHGANTTEAISLAYSEVTHPHNDWLRLRYEYGLLGMLLFAMTMLGQVGHALRRLRQMPPEAAIFLWVGAGAFLPMALFMFSDNVILYAAWFGNLQFAMLGLGYAALQSVKRGGPGRAIP
jgi:O-antigen ligase